MCCVVVSGVWVLIPGCAFFSELPGRVMYLRLARVCWAGNDYRVFCGWHGVDATGGVAPAREDDRRLSGVGAWFSFER